jgi:hypothetical protein
MTAQQGQETERLRLEAERLAKANADQQAAQRLQEARTGSTTFGQAVTEYLSSGGYSDRTGARRTGMPGESDFTANAAFFQAIKYIQDNSTSDVEKAAAMAAASAAVGTLAQAQAAFGATGTFVDRFGYRHTGSGPREDQFMDDPAFQAVLQLFRSIVPAHAGGGIASGWSLVGEQGPELAHFGSPARIYTADQTRAALYGGGGAVQSVGGVSEEKVDALCDAVREGNALLREIASRSTRDIEKQTAELKTSGKENARETGREMASATEARARR